MLSLVAIVTGWLCKRASYTPTHPFLDPPFYRQQPVTIATSESIIFTCFATLRHLVSEKGTNPFPEADIIGPQISAGPYPSFLSSLMLLVAESQMAFLSMNRSLFPREPILLFMSLSLHVHGSITFQCLSLLHSFILSRVGIEAAVTLRFNKGMGWDGWWRQSHERGGLSTP